MLLFLFDTTCILKKILYKAMDSSTAVQQIYLLISYLHDVQLSFHEYIPTFCSSEQLFDYSWCAPNQKISPSQSLSENALLLPLQNAKNNLVSTFKILWSIPLENHKQLTTFQEGQKFQIGETTEASASSAAHDVFADFYFVFQTKALKNKTLMKCLILVPKQLNLTGFTPKERAAIGVW